MIAYVDCLSPELLGGGGVRVGARCWKGGYSEDEDELLPLCSKDVRKMPSLQPKSEGSLRRRLLTSKIHQQRDTLWAPRPLAQGPPDNQGLQGPLHRQDYPGPYPEPKAKPSPSGLVLHHLTCYSSQGSQQHRHNTGYSLTQLQRTSYSPPTPDPHPGYSFALPPSSPPGAARYSHTGPRGYPNPGAPGYLNPGPPGYPNPGYPGYTKSNPGYCNPTYTTSPSRSPNQGHHSTAKGPSNSYPNTGYPSPGQGSTLSPPGPSNSYPNTGYPSPGQGSTLSPPGPSNSYPNTGYPSPGQGSTLSPPGPSNSYPNTGYPSPGQGSTLSPPGPSYSSTLGFAPQSQPSLPSTLPQQRKSFSPFHLLRRRSYNSSHIPFSHTPQRQDWRAVSLDKDRKWSVHYTSQNPQQETRPSCVDNLRTVLRGVHVPECDRKLRSDGYGSSQYLSQNPAYLNPSQSEDRLHDDKAGKDRSRKKSTAASPDEDLLAYSFRPPPSPPLNCYENIDDTVNGGDITTTVAEETEWTKPLPLPTPEEKMRQQAQAIAADIVPINITGESFERQASFRRALANTDTLIRHPRNKLTRRKTITGIPDDVTRDLEHEADEGSGCSRTVVLPGQYSTLGRTGSVNTALLHRSIIQRSQTQSHTPSHTPEAGQTGEERREEGRLDEERREEEEERKEERRVVKSSVRRIRAQRGQGISSLMASLTPTLTPNPSLKIHPHPSLTLTPSSSMGSVSLAGEDSGEGFHSLPHQDTLSSVNSCLSTPYRTLCDTAPCSKDHVFQRQSGKGWSSKSQSQSTFLREDWSYEPLLPSSHSSPLHPLSSISSPSQTDCSSLCSWDADTAGHSPLQGLKSHSHGCISANYATGNNRCPQGNQDHHGLHSNSCNLSRSISLRKSKSPPAPPTRSTSLLRKTGQGKPLRYNFKNDPNKPGDREVVVVAVQRSLQTPSPAPVSPPVSPGGFEVFEDPWVPRCLSLSSLSRGERRAADTASQINQVPHFHSFHQQPNPGQYLDYPPSSHLKQPQHSVPRSASTGGVSLPMGPKMTASSPKMAASAGRLQRLASNSSGYSSQCNTPTPSSPQTSSSPQTPSSPLPSSSSLPLTSSLPRTRSTPGRGGPKPPIPERKSSLLSSPSSSFSSTSSLSSYTSADSARYPPLPPLPLLPGSNTPPSLPPPPPYPSLPQRQSLPSPPPLPQLCISRSLPSTPPLPQLYLPSPPPLPQPSLPSPPPLPQAPPELKEPESLSLPAPHRPLLSRLTEPESLSLPAPHRPLLSRLTEPESLSLPAPHRPLLSRLTEPESLSLPAPHRPLLSRLTEPESLSLPAPHRPLLSRLTEPESLSLPAPHPTTAQQTDRTRESVPPCSTPTTAQQTDRTRESVPPCSTPTTAQQTDRTTEAVGTEEALIPSTTPQTPRTPQKPKTLEKPRKLEKPRIPENPRTPEASMLEKPRTREKPRIPENPRTPEASMLEKPRTREKPRIPENPRTPEARMLEKPRTLEKPRIPENPSTSEARMLKKPRTLEKPRIPENPRTSEARMLEKPITLEKPRTPEKPKVVVLSRPLRAVVISSSPHAENSEPVLQNREHTPRQETTPCHTNGQLEHSAWANTPTHSPATPSSTPHKQKPPVALKKPKLSLIMPPPLLRTHQTDTPTPPPVLTGTPPQPFVPETPPLLGINLAQTESQTETQPKPKPEFPFLKRYQTEYYVPELPPRPCPPEPCVPELPPRPCPTEPCVPELPPRPCPTEPCVPELPPRPCPPEPCVPELPPRPCPTEPCVPELPPRPCPPEPCVPELPPRPCPTEPCVPELPPRPCPPEPCVPELPPRPCPTEPCVPELPPRPCPTEPCVPELPPRPCPPEPCVPELPPRPCPPEPCVAVPQQELGPLEMETDTEIEAETKAECGSVPYTELGRSEPEPEESWVMQEEEEEEEKEGEEVDSSDSGSFSLEEKRDALSSALSTDNLRGALLLPGLPLQEEEGELGEKREERRGLETDRASSSTGSLSSREDNGEVFDISSAEDLVTPARPRTTEDLFAAIHRSKRKVLCRRNSEGEQCCVFSSSSSSSSSSPPMTPTGPSPTPLRTLEVIGSSRVRGHRSGVSSSSSSDSFKALLLRKGSRCDPAARMSATERLRITAPKHQSPPPQRQSSQSQPQSDTHLQLRVKSHTHTPQPSPHTHLDVPQPQYRQRPQSKSSSCP
ncbi:NHS-like protein 1 [Coregonus clupeaformis]|uniref:NHS-like protein 1 n=1 Tax=Coregonus clupeaformis TaxID=59861 RepID=UPI001E1C955B|nr:NHS-like protein 1 [Coregonus clupeaformis]